MLEEVEGFEELGCEVEGLLVGNITVCWREYKKV